MEFCRAHCTSSFHSTCNVLYWLVPHWQHCHAKKGPSDATSRNKNVSPLKTILVEQCFISLLVALKISPSGRCCHLSPKKPSNKIWEMRLVILLVMSGRTSEVLNNLECVKDDPKKVTGIHIHAIGAHLFDGWLYSEQDTELTSTPIMNLGSFLIEWEEWDEKAAVSIVHIIYSIISIGNMTSYDHLNFVRPVVKTECVLIVDSMMKA